MEAFTAHGTQGQRHGFGAAAASPQVISAAEFKELLVSYRKLVRADRRHEKLRGLQDLDTGELFVTDEHRLLEPIRRPIGA